MRWGGCLALGLAACSTSTPDPQESAAACNQAATEVSAALVGNEACTHDSDCTLLAPPSCVSAVGSVSINEVPVAVVSLPAMEHTFSIIEAEVCPQCGSTPAAQGIGTGSVPVAVCANNGESNACVATTGAGPSQPGVGSFEWDCTVGCGPQGFCDVDNPEASAACPGWPGYWTIVDPGLCASTIASGSGQHCSTDFACPFMQSCQAFVCASGCTSFEPTTCEGDCQLLSNNHGCMICACDSDAGCPTPPLDGG